MLPAALQADITVIFHLLFVLFLLVRIHLRSNIVLFFVIHLAALFVLFLLLLVLDDVVEGRLRAYLFFVFVVVGQCVAADLLGVALVTRFHDHLLNLLVH